MTPSLSHSGSITDKKTLVFPVNVHLKNNLMESRNCCSHFTFYPEGVISSQSVMILASLLVSCSYFFLFYSPPALLLTFIDFTCTLFFFFKHYRVHHFLARSQTCYTLQPCLVTSTRTCLCLCLTWITEFFALCVSGTLLCSLVLPPLGPLLTQISDLDLVLYTLDLWTQTNITCWLVH